MVGKPNFPDDVDARGDRKGSAVGTPGLTALDEEREASLADEGGASGAVIESQDLETLRRLAEELPVAHLQPAEPDGDQIEEEEEGHDDDESGTRMAVLVAALSFAGAALGVLAYRRWLA
jgi:hypothetical protein